MRTFSLTPLLIVSLVFILIASWLGWLTLQNRQYVDRMTAANARQLASVRPAPATTPARATSSDAPVVLTSIAMERDSIRLVSDDLRNSVRTLESIDAPLTWKTYHGARIRLQRAMLTAYAARDARLAYAGQFLGDRPSLSRISTLRNDPGYLALRTRRKLAFQHAEASDRALKRLTPLIASRLPGSPQRSQYLNLGWSGAAEDDLLEAARCATAERANEPAPARDCARLLVHVPAE